MSCITFRSLIVLKKSILFYSVTSQRVALWLLLLLLQPVHLAVLSAGLCPHHVGHHAGQEAGHHVPPTPADQQGDGPPHPVPHLDT